MRTIARNVTRILACFCLTIGASSEGADPEQRVLRIEYTTDPGSEAGMETGVVFWRREVIQPAEVPGDLLQTFADGFPVPLKMEGKLANACYVTNGRLGLALLERTESRLSGPLWFTVDWAWRVEFLLQSNGTVRGTTGATALKGSHREVADFSECYEMARSATAGRALPNTLLDRHTSM